MFYLILWVTYVSLFSLSLLTINGLNLKNKPYNVLILVISLIFSLIVFIFGPDYSPDYDMFNDWYQRSALENFGQSWVSLKDPAFYFMSRFFNWLGLTYDYMNLFFCFISTSAMMTLMRKKDIGKYIFVILLIYYSRFYYVHDFTQVRFSVAIILSTMGYFYLAERKYIKAIVLIAIAITFHMSAAFSIIPILCFLLPKKNIWMKATLLSLLSFIVLSSIVNPDSIINVFQSIPIVYNRLLPYFNGSYTVQETRIITTYFAFKFIILLWVTFILLSKNKSWKKEYLNLVYTIYVSIMLSIAFRSNDAIALRFVEYFSIFDIIFMFESFTFINENSSRARLSKSVFCFGVTILSIIWILSSIKLF